MNSRSKWWLATAVLALAGLAIADEASASKELTVAALHYSPGPIPADNLRQLRSLVSKAARQGASIVVLPEHALFGPFRDGAAPDAPQRFWEVAAAQSERALSVLAKENAIWIVSSAAERAPGSKGLWINTIVFDHSGQMAARQAKLSPRRDWGDGDAIPGDSRALNSLDFPGGRIGALSGDDMELAVPRLARLGAETLLVSASWQQDDLVAWRDLARTLAARHHVNIVVSNLSLPSASQAISSLVIDREGTIRSEIGPDSQVVIANVPIRAAKAKYVSGLPSPPEPIASAGGVDPLAFGRKLFFDGGLAADGKTSCAACHDPAKAFGDGKRLAVGVFDREGHRNTPSLLNSVYKTYYGWDGAADTMERQAMHALLGWAEMNRTLDEAAAYVNRSPGYASFKDRAGTPIEGEQILSAICSYIRTLVSGASAFDRYQFDSDRQAISEEARRGLALFRGKAKCAQCHEIRSGYALFSDNRFHNTGVGFHKRFEYLGYSGDGLEGNQATKNRFRGEYFTPTLRDIALTAPYMHDGSFATLAEVVEFYNRGANPNPFLDPRLAPLNLTAAEKSDLIAFLETLTGTSARVQEPESISARKR